MPFSASTCLSYTGTTTLTNPIRILSDLDSYSSPFTSITLNQITSGNCPLVLTGIPDGTTTIRLKSANNFCCDIVLTCNDLCTTCDLNFNTYSATTIGQIVAGNITGSCDSSITDYLIYWYEVGDPITPVFTSGYGTEFQPYNYIHPLTGTSFVLVPSGTYEPIIDKVVISGLTFSQTGGTGTILANLNCLPTFTVNALKCDDVDGGSDLTQYSHKFSYSAQTGGVIPESVSTTFELSASTNYFTWRFQGQSIPDEVKLTFVGSAYSNNPIVLDYWKIGTSGVTTSVTPTTYPRRFNTQNFFGKVISLSGLSVTTGDNILIEVIPSTANTQTSWTFYCGCLDEFNCDICTPSSATTVSGTTSYQFKISANTITAITETCGVRIKLSVISDCPYSSYTGSSYTLYSPSYTVNNVYLPDNKIDWGPGGDTQTAQMVYNQTLCTLVPQQFGTSTCVTSGSSVTITYEKSPNLFRVISNNLSVLNTHFYQPYLSNIVPNISPFSGDNTNVGFYKYFRIQYTNATGAQTCGDGVGTRDIYFHQTSVVTTGTTGSNYYIDFTMPTVSYGMSFSFCDLDCENATRTILVGRVNNSSTGITSNYTGTTNQGVVSQNGLSEISIVTENLFTQTATTISGTIEINGYNNYTYPYSGTPATIIPSLSSQTCDISSLTDGTSFYIKTYYQYTAEFYDVNDLLGSFRIFAREINANGTANQSVKTLVYELTNGFITYTDPQYLV